MSVHIQPPKSYGNFVDGKQIGAVERGDIRFDKSDVRFALG